MDTQLLIKFSFYTKKHTKTVKMFPLYLYFHIFYRIRIYNFRYLQPQSTGLIKHDTHFRSTSEIIGFAKKSRMSKIEGLMFQLSLF